MEKKKKKRQMLCNFVCILWVCDPFKLFEFFLWREEEGSFSKRKLEGCFFLVVGYIVGVVMVY